MNIQTLTVVMRRVISKSLAVSIASTVYCSTGCETFDFHDLSRSKKLSKMMAYVNDGSVKCRRLHMTGLFFPGIAALKIPTTTKVNAITASDPNKGSS